MKKRIPKFIDLAGLAREFNPSASKEETQLITDRFAYLLGTIYENYLNYNEDDDGDEEDFTVRLLASRLQKVLGKEYLRYKEITVKKGYLIVDRSYSPKSYSKGHWLVFPEGFNDNDYTYVIKSALFRSLVSRQEKVFAQQYGEPIKYKYAHLERWLRDGKLKIDVPRAIKLIRNNLRLELDKISRGEKVGKSKKVQQCPALAFRRAQRHLKQVRKIRQGDLQPIVDRTSQRLHSELTRIPKFLRTTITYDGKSLVALDLKNSQPYLIISLFNRETWNRNQSFSVQQLFKAFYEKWEKLSNKEKSALIETQIQYTDDNRHLQYNNYGSSVNSIPIMLGEVFQKVEYQAASINNIFTHKIIIDDSYSQWCSNGIFYEKVEEKLKGQFRDDNGNDLFGNRDATKKQIMKIFYGEYNKWVLTANRPSDQSRCELFRLVPHVFNMLFILKAFQFRDCPIMLQKLESNLFLRKISHKLVIEGITPVFTIHDSIVVVDTPENRTNVARTMSEILCKFVGVPPALKIEPWTE